MAKTDLINFLTRVQASPPQGLIIRGRSDLLRTVKSGLKHLRQPFVILSTTPALRDQEFFAQLDQAANQHAWLILDIKRDVTPAVYASLRELASTGHITDHAANKDYPISGTQTRILGIIQNKELENSAFETLLVNFGLIFRNQ